MAEVTKITVVNDMKSITRTTLPSATVQRRIVTVHGLALSTHVSHRAEKKPLARDRDT